MAGRPIRTLVVDDADNWRGYLCLELEHLGCEVVAATNLAEGLAALETGHFALAVVDVRLISHDERDLSGLAIVREAWQQRKVDHIVILSGHVTRSEIQEALGAAIPCSVFDKGENQEALWPALQRLVGIARTIESQPAEVQAGTSREEQRVAARKALVVEDTESWSDLYRVALERQGFVVQTARAYADAVGLVRREPFDLAVADLELVPGSEARCDAGPQNLNGIFLIEWFLERKVPFIIVTGHARPGVVDPIYKEFPVFQIMDKAGFTLDEFEAYVREALDRPPKEGQHAASDDQTRRRQTFERLVRDALASCADAPETTDTLQRMARHHRLNLEIDDLVDDLGLDQPVPPRTSIAAIRKLLLESFTDKDLRRLCRDDEALRPLIARMPQAAGLMDMVDEVLDYCENQQLWDEFWAAVAEANPRRVRQFAGRIRAAQEPGA